MGNSVLDAALRDLAADRDRIVERIMQAVRTEVPGYRAMHAEGLHDVRGGTERTLDMLTRPGSDRNRSMFRRIGRRRADQVVPLDDIVRAAAVSQREVLAWIGERCGRTKDGLEAALELSRRVTDLFGVAVSETVGGYLGVPGTSADEQARRDLLEDLLSGRLPRRGEARALLSALDFDAGAVYEVGVCALADEGPQHEELRTVSGAIERHLQRQPLLVVVRHEEIVFVARSSGDPPVERQLEEMVRAVGTAHGIEVRAGISTPVAGLGEVQRGYDEARRALRAAIDRGRAVVRLSALSLVDYLVSQADTIARRIVPEGTRRLAEEDARHDGSLIATLEAYADADLNVARAAAALVVHPNTVHYRLRRVAEVSGSDPRDMWSLVNLLAAVRLLRAG